MKQSLVRLVRPRRPERDVAPLLPPLTLYKSILRAHIRYLPVEIRTLGDSYVKQEFRNHQKIDNPLHIVGFLTQWQDYLKAMEVGSWTEGRLTKQELEKMSPEQIGQLYELMQETKKIGEDN
ncbi:hypothetical protein DFJ63DRAFT_97900 [Scheffersomyces coipomensis]|uniref:uncharacterized protein n=1 Tax=Scheffersomyces coipomensis TaxID=1788519 RepID=UPI00315DA679